MLLTRSVMFHSSFASRFSFLLSLLLLCFALLQSFNQKFEVIIHPSPSDHILGISIGIRASHSLDWINLLECLQVCHLQLLDPGNPFPLTMGRTTRIGRIS